MVGYGEAEARAEEEEGIQEREASREDGHNAVRRSDTADRSGGSEAAGQVGSEEGGEEGDLRGYEEEDASSLAVEAAGTVAAFEDGFAEDIFEPEG